MLRIAMRRVLTEEEDPAKMAHGLAKLSGALGRAIVLQENRERTQGQDEEESLADLLNEILIDLEKESRVARAARKEDEDDRAWRQDSELADTG